LYLKVSLAISDGFLGVPIVATCVTSGQVYGCKCRQAKRNEYKMSKSRNDSYQHGMAPFVHVPSTMLRGAI
jgi:hypothetical protein